MLYRRWEVLYREKVYYVFLGYNCMILNMVMACAGIPDISIYVKTTIRL